MRNRAHPKHKGQTSILILSWLVITIGFPHCQVGCAYFEVKIACYTQKFGVSHRKFNKLTLKSAYLMEKQTQFSTLLPLKNHTLSRTTLQNLTLCSIKSCKNQ